MVNRPLAAIIGIAYVVLIAVLVWREVRRQQGLLQGRRRRGVPIPLPWRGRR